MRMKGTRVTGGGLSCWMASLSLFVLVACGGSGKTRSDDLVSWRIEVSSLSDAGYGARILLNGGEVYSEAGSTLSRHSVDVVRSYVGGENVVEVEILAASVSPAEYAATCTAEVSSTSQVIHADGVPTSLGVGGSLFLRISL